MTNKCNHNDLDYLGILTYKDFPEKLYRCKKCTMTITDYATNKELRSESN